MTYEFQGREEPKIRPHREPRRVKTGSRKSYRTTDTPVEEVDIDPAEFFDPEEFGCCTVITVKAMEVYFSGASHRLLG
jgi:hypothetical protein